MEDNKHVTQQSSLASAVDREQRRRMNSYPEWDEEEDEEDDRDPNLDPGFGSWDDFNRYMYG